MVAPTSVSRMAPVIEKRVSDALKVLQSSVYPHPFNTSRMKM